MVKLRGLLCPVLLHRLEVSPKLESSSDVPPPLPPRSPVPPPDDHAGPFTPPSSPSSPPISPSNPFLPHMQHNPFFEELVAEESHGSPPSPGSSPFHYITVASQPCTPSPDATSVASIKRERPRPVARQVSLPAPDPSGEWEQSFDAFASSRLHSPKGGPPPHKQPRTSPTSPRRRGGGRPLGEEPPPLPPRRPVRPAANEIYSDGWLHRGQELAVHKEAYLLSQTGAASLQRGREEEGKRSGASPHPRAGGGVRSRPDDASPGFACEEKLRKFRYEPLQDDSDCWGGLLFEQDLYGRTCKGKQVTNPHLPLGTEVTLSKTLLDGEISVTELLNMSPPLNPDAEVAEITSTSAEETADEFILPETNNNNNVSFSLTLEDLNMNVSNSDFSFIDSDASSQSEAAETLKGTNGSVETFRPPRLVVYHTETPPEELFTSRDTYTPETNPCFEITPSSTKLCKVSPHEPIPESSKLPARSCDDDTGREDAFNATHSDLDDNGNLDVKLGSSGAVSARCRHKAVTQQNGGRANKRGDASGDAEFEQLLTLVQNISGAGDGPRSNSAGDDQADDSTVQRCEISFKDLHALVAPSSRPPPKTGPGPGPGPDSSASSGSADLHPTSTHPCTTLAVAPYTSDQPQVDARHSLLPEGTQPASSLPRQESR